MWWSHRTPQELRSGSAHSLWMSLKQLMNRNDGEFAEMPSPFPGMDPYLEDPGFWQGFHTTFLTAMRAAITPMLPPGLYADLEQHIWFREEEHSNASVEGKTKQAKPDVYILEGPVEKKAGKRSKSGAAVCTPPTYRTTMPNIVREVGQHTVRIRDLRNRKVITAIELLSPSNKNPGADRDRYLLKRDEFIANGTHMVEIDLLRSGHRLPINPVPDGDYYVYVTNAAFYNEVAIWVFTVRDPMPSFQIPLTPQHAPIVLSPRPCFDRAYDEANYGPQINYALPPVPPLRRPDAEWAGELLKKAAKRRKK